MLKDIYDFMTLQQSIVFVEMKAEADSVAAMMRQAGFEVSEKFLCSAIATHCLSCAIQTVSMYLWCVFCCGSGITWVAS